MTIGKFLSITSLITTPFLVGAFTTTAPSAPSWSRQNHHALQMAAAGGDDQWTGNVVSNTADGVIQGCSIQQAEGGGNTEWIVTIDGVEADLGRFSEAIYRKIIGDAKRERFQGFRPGTIPPHLEPTYRTFSMDECARETVLEAMQQNNIRPFEAARNEMLFENFVIPPASTKKKRKKKKKKKKGSDGQPAEEVVAKEEEEEQAPQWRTFETMKEAVDAGWKPGQSFSFVAKNVKGQKVLTNDETAGATPLGLDY